MKDGSPRILIIQLSAIGDVVRTLPGLQALRDFFPSARIDWGVERKSAGILLGHPSIDTLHVFERDESQGFWHNVGQYRLFLSHLRSEKYDIVVDFHGSWKSGYAGWQCRARERYCLAGSEAKSARRARGGEWFSNKRVKLPRVDLNRVEENLLLTDPLAPRPRSLSYSIYVQDVVHEYIDDYFEDTYSGAKLKVALHAPVDKRSKRWPEDRFAALADMLLADGRFEVLLTYGPGQREVAERVQMLSRRKPLFAPETPGLTYYAWLIHQCDLYVGGDTGPMHIANAMGTPVVAVFGSTDPQKHAPFDVLHEVVRSDSEGGVRDVSAEEVYDACVRVVSRLAAASALHHQSNVPRGTSVLSEG